MASHIDEHGTASWLNMHWQESKCVMLCIIYPKNTSDPETANALSCQVIYRILPITFDNSKVQYIMRFHGK
ncbi:conserved hypothetical protein [Ricinus communis]|uniref:Uncharacterized protein n=1 Tax=Ricinus communis TaxID=3988 RepID=B9RY27_RICCO|nr:conserved hypothetical protein [Ricinus communis]